MPSGKDTENELNEYMAKSLSTQCGNPLIGCFLIIDYINYKNAKLKFILRYLVSNEVIG